MGVGFLTEKDMEALLVEETRTLPMPDGTAKVVRNFKMTWTNYDIVLKYGPLSAIEISTLMMFRAAKFGLEPGHALREVLIPLRRQANKVLERNIARRKQRIALRESLLSSFNGAAKETRSASTVSIDGASEGDQTPLIFRRFRADR